MRALLDGVAAACVVVDGDDRPIWANRVALDMAGDTPIGTNRFLLAVAAAEEVRTARGSHEVRGTVRLPTDVGLIEREVVATALEGDAVLVSFAGATGRPGEDHGDELRARLEAMLEHTADMITVLDRDGTIRFSNAAAGRVTGLAGAEVNGRAAFDLIHPDDLPRVAEFYGSVLDHTGPAEPIEFRLRFADGSWHDVEATVNNLLGREGIDGLVVSMHDITERKAGEQRVESLLANITDIIVLLNREFEVTFATSSIARVIDAPPETNIGMSAFNDIHPDDLENTVTALTQVRDAELGSAVTVEVRLEAVPGSERWRWLEATAVNLLDDPTINGIVVTLRDVTERREAADQLRAAYEREKANAERLAELDRLKDDFLATVSHELRTPLASVVGFSELLRRSDIEEPVRSELLLRLVTSATEMRSMVDNLLDYSALEAGRIGLATSTVDLLTAAREAIDGLSHQLAAHDVELDGDGAVAVADPIGVGHIVRNLLTNAAKYSPAGTSIRVRVSSDDGHAALAVEDQGAGIHPGDIDRIFERFYRAPSASFAARGTGIGLNIARRYAELMGGTLMVVSTPGNGSTFTLRLPARG